MAVGTTVKQGDTLPALVRQVLNDPVWPARVGVPIDFSAATRIFWVLRHEETKTVLGAWAADIVGDPTNGTTTTPLVAEMSAHPGLVSIDIVVEEAGGVRTFPATPQDLNSSFMVRRSLTVPDVVSIPTITPATGNNEVDLGVTLPLVEGVELFVLTAIDGVNQPGIYRWDATAGAYVSAESATGGGTDIDSDVHIQTVASTTWIHAHGLGRNVSISVFDGLDPTAPGSPVTGQVSFIDLNTVQIEFGSARTGHSVAT